MVGTKKCRQRNLVSKITEIVARGPRDNFVRAL